MQLIDVTNSYSRMIQHELVKSPVHFIKVYTLGNSKSSIRKSMLFLRSSSQTKFVRSLLKKLNLLKLSF